MATTIQITSEEDQKITEFKKILGFSSKKAVVMEGLRVLAEQLNKEKRLDRLQKASLLVRRQSTQTNREWAPHSPATKIS